MKLVVNGVERETACATLAQLWDEERRAREVETQRGFAIALNGAVVRRDKWEATSLGQGDRVEIVRAFSGG
jgi:sulfur carrier protein